MEVLRDSLAQSGGAVADGAFEAALAVLMKGGQVETTEAGLRCLPECREVLTRAAVAEGSFEGMARAVKRVLPVAVAWNRMASFRTWEQGLREVRIAFYRQDSRGLQQALWEMSRQFPADGVREPPLVAICAHPFDRDWFLSLSAPIRAAAAGEMLSWSALRLVRCDELLHCLEHDGLRVPPAVRVFQADLYILQGRFEDASTALREVEGPALAVRQAWMAFLRGDTDGAVAQFESGLHDLRREQTKADCYFRSYGGLFHLLALLRSGSEAHLERLRQYLPLAVASEPLWRGVCGALRELAMVASGGVADLPELSAAVAADVSPAEGGGGGPDALVLLEQCCRLMASPEAGAAASVEALWRRCDEAGFAWAASEAAALLTHLGGHAAAREQAQAFRERTGTVGLVGTLTLGEPWERTLEALAALGQEPLAAEPSEVERRLVWFVKPGEREGEPVQLRAAEQHRSAKGTWTRGRSVALFELHTLAGRPGCLTEQDHRICAAIAVRSDRWQPEQVTYEIRAEVALPEMVGHPLLFWEDNPRLRLELVRGEPELVVRERGEVLELTLSPPSRGDERVLLLRDSPTRLRLVQLDAVHSRLSALLEGGLVVPSRARERLRQALGPLASRLVVQSDIGSLDTSATPVPADTTLHLHLLPSGAGLTVELLVQPFGAAGPAYVPGQGGTTVAALVGGRRLETQRDLADEVRRSQAVAAACPALGSLASDRWSASLEDPEDCLELLLQVQALPAGVSVEWPEGRSLSVSRRLSSADLHLSVRRQRDWFAVSGDVQVNEDLTVSLAELIRLTAGNGGRFVPLGDGQYLALADDFRRRLEDLALLGEPRREGLRFHPLAAAALEGLTEDIGGLEADGEWRENLSRLEASQRLEASLPAGLQADLRDYQVEGYRWLCRLAAWGAGACLADDMGLGKTVQALSAILARSAGGPSLVVAPTSVCLNWRDEAQRFTPGLRVCLYGDGDRAEMLRQAGPGDLVICSYGLMQTGREALSAVTWETIVLDEAQAIKNPRAKRSQVAFRLRGRFRVLTTGTPIENNLGELWSLFRFINPGLLGSWEHFSERFALPVERDHDDSVRERLRRLIAPFILRRTKREVLAELPARTEVLQHVQLSERERAFYEALRRESLRRIGDQTGGPGARRMQILAEITRLRQACCNPRLIVPHCDIDSAKLEAFDGIVEELLANRHKALVFSQFVTHLSLVREHLDRKAVRYQYLDGSTPPRERAERVAAFQRGEGDVFLISLKAGGTGLNLTAADYVIHLDPWWNPAVEDQASDRAHRIGQVQPVTIYRLVAADTIEDRIVELHQRKRDLADSLLSGSGVPSAVSAEELLRLMAGE